MSARSSRVRILLVAASLATAFVLLNSPARAGTWSHDAAVNLQLVKLPGDQCVQDMVPDGGHGAIVFYVDPCGDPLASSPPLVSLHSMHVLGKGEFDPAWSSAALPGTKNIYGYVLMPDGTGGAFVGWADQRNVATTGRDLYVQHVRPNGTPDPAWPVGGRAVCTAPGTQITPAMTSDGTGGVILAWTDRRDSVTSFSDVYAAHVRANGTLDPAWTVNGVAVVKTNGIQQSALLTSDGAGGAIVTWSDTRNAPTSADVYAGHVRANGTMDPAWPVNGRAVLIANGFQNPTHIITDGAGGAFVSWHDALQRPSFQHVLANGTLDAAWPATGVVLDASATAMDDLQLAADGGTGVYALWDAVTNTVANNDLYARHILASGVSDPAWPIDPLRLEPGASNKTFFSSAAPLAMGDGSFLFDWQDDRFGPLAVFAGRLLPWGIADPAWPAAGRLVMSSGGSFPSVAKVFDGRGGALYSWTDVRDSVSTNYDVYGDRLGVDGLRGVDQPEWHAVSDIKGDQGGKVSLQWYWSSFDNMPADPLSSYNVWRRLDAAAVPADMARQALPASSSIPLRPGEVRVRGTGAASTFWEFLVSVPPRGVPNYALTVQTRADSTAAGTAWETYEIDAVAAATAYSSYPDSAYSVDNLAPPGPAGFAGTYASGNATMVWDPLLVSDLANYRLYRGASAGFVPGPGNRIASPTTTHFTDPAGTPAYYKLTGVDVHGNEGPAAALMPAGTTGVGNDTRPTQVSLALISPSPAHTLALFELGLPRASQVQLAVFDAAGRRVRTLFAQATPAGVRTLSWDLRDDAGRMSGDGLYFARLDAGGVLCTARIAVVR